MHLKLILFLCLLVSLKGAYGQNTKAGYSSFSPGNLWLDNNGEHINAHGGGILYHNGSYYWFGEHKGKNSNSALIGVTCYSSNDLYNWKYEGVALPVVEGNNNSPIAKGCIIERPKVIYNENTKKFVMYFHLELKGRAYGPSYAGVATSESINGPYTFVRASRVNPGYWPENMPEKDWFPRMHHEDYKKWWAPEWTAAVKKGLYVHRDLVGGQMSRDMTLFVDDDKKAYHIYSSEENLTLHIAELSEDYTQHTGKYIRIEPTGHNEAPAIFKKDDKYYMITSGCTGWDPNAARLLVAEDILGEWKLYPNPCVGKDADITFHSQSTFILPVHGKKDAYIFMADRWTPKNPIDGRYVWLPIQFNGNLPVLKWMNSWDLSVFDKGDR